jgi:ribosomal protein L37E
MAEEGASAPTFRIGREACGAFIWCLRCNRRSFNVNDIANLYCGFCHEFHWTPIDDAAEKQAWLDHLSSLEPAS